MLQSNTAFEARLEQVSRDRPGLHAALIEVADTAETCRVWFESQGLTPTPADVIAMTALVLDRQVLAQQAFHRDLVERDLDGDG